MKILWPCDMNLAIITDTPDGHRGRPGYKGSLAYDIGSYNGVKIPLWASADGGVVEEAHADKTGYGNEVIIVYQDLVRIQCGHLDSFSVKIGDKVKLKQQIGIMGTTGASSGVHVHFAVWEKVARGWLNVDPLFENMITTSNDVIVNQNVPAFPILPKATSLQALNVRSGPGTTYPVTRTLNKNLTIAVMGAQRNPNELWLHIGYNQWIAMEYYNYTNAMWV